MAIKTIKLSDLYIGQPECIDYWISQIHEKNDYMLKMIDNFNNLPLISVIDLGDCFSLMDGHHRVAAHIFLSKLNIKIEVLND